MDEDTVARHILDACSDYTLRPGQVAPLMWHQRAAKAIVREHRRDLWVHRVVCIAGFVVGMALSAWLL
jgi:hypothetical protein